MSNSTNIRKAVDPCKQFTQFDVPLLVTAMGLLPRCIDWDSDSSLLVQVVQACGLVNLISYKVIWDIDKDGSYQLRDHSIKYAIGVMSRYCNGDYQAIYFYPGGDVIVVDRSDQFQFQMDG